MTVDRTAETIIDIEEFLATCVREVEVPVHPDKVREVELRLGNVTFRRFEARVGDLFEARTSSAWDTDPERTRRIPPTEAAEERRPLLFRELFDSDDLLRGICEEMDRTRQDRPTRSEPRMMTLHCSTCDARWTLDGNNGFLTLCRKGRMDETVTVTEMTSPDWSGLHRVCTCVPGRN